MTEFSVIPPIVLFWAVSLTLLWLRVGIAISLMVGGAATFVIYQSDTSLLMRILTGTISRFSLDTWVALPVIAAVFARSARFHFDHETGDGARPNPLMVFAGSAAALPPVGRGKADPDMSASSAAVAPFGLPVLLSALLLNESVTDLALSFAIPGLLLGLAAWALASRGKPLTLTAIIRGVASAPVFLGLAALSLLWSGLTIPLSAIAAAAFGVFLVRAGSKGPGAALDEVAYGLRDGAAIAFIVLAFTVSFLMLQFSLSAGPEPSWERWDVVFLLIGAGVLSFAFGAAGGVLATVVFMSPAWPHLMSAGFPPTPVIALSLLAGEAGRFARAAVTGGRGLAPVDAAWLALLLLATVAFSSTDAWVFSFY